MTKIVLQDDVELIVIHSNSMFNVSSGILSSKAVISIITNRIELTESNSNVEHES